MKLYEATNGYCGQCPVCVYVWAQDAAEARTLAEASYKKDNPANPDYLKRLVLKELLDSEMPAFATKPDDCGWEIW